jgi:predicted dehydrogenase
LRTPFQITWILVKSVSGCRLENMRMSRSGVQIGVIGCGWVSQTFHLPALLGNPHVDGVLAADPSGAALDAVRRISSFVELTSDWRRVANDQKLDAVMIAVPNAEHARVAIECLRAGKHVFVEKPLALNVREGVAIMDEAALSNRFVMVGHCWRWHPDVRALRDRIARGELGRIVKTRGYGAHVGWGPSGWFTDPRLSGGGAILDMGIHAIDSTRFLLGDPDFDRVEAFIGNPYAHLDVEDDAIILVTWADGTYSTVECGWWQPYVAGSEAQTEVYGTKGAARIWEFAVAPEAFELSKPDMYRIQVEQFVDGIRFNRQPEPSGDVGLENLRVVEAAYASGGRLWE